MVSTYYIIVHKLGNKYLYVDDARCKHEDCRYYNLNQASTALFIYFPEYYSLSPEHSTLSNLSY